MASPQTPMRQIGLRVSEKVYGRLEVLAKEAGMPVGTFAGLLFDGAYAARVKSTPDADLEAQIALVGLATISGRDLKPLADAAGLPTGTAERMRDGWQTILVERRRGL